MADSDTPKQRARDYMHYRQEERKPPPTQQEIRRQLGWDLAEAARIERERQEKRNKK